MVNFRCFEQVRLEIPPAGVIFVGENAQGKTSLLEAGCVLLRLQSPRARQLRQLIREETERFGIAGELDGVQLQVRGHRQGLQMSVNGELLASRRDYLEASGLVVWLGNDDLDLVRGGGESRRRYLDFVASQVDLEYRHHWMRYRKALRLRNRSLKTLPPYDPSVKAFTALMMEHGTEIIHRRQKLCEELSPEASEFHRRVSGAVEDIQLAYIDRSKGDLAAHFGEVEEAEERRRVTLAGPHRDDLKLTLLGRTARDFGSEGQQRTLALALKLAQGAVLQARGKQVPIYLIDDVFGELDPRRRNALMDCLPPGSQKLITTTHLDWWTGEKEQLPTMTVRSGTVIG